MRLEHLRLDGDGGWGVLQSTTMSNDGWWYSRRPASLVENSSVAWVGIPLALRRFDFASGAVLDFPVWNLAWVGAVTPDLVDCATPTSLCRFSVDGGLQHLVGDPVVPGFVDGPAATARFSVITDVAVARDGTRYVADSTNLALRLVTPAGVVSTIARLSDAPRAIALDESGPRPRLWVLVTDALLVAEPP